MNLNFEQIVIISLCIVIIILIIKIREQGKELRRVIGKVIDFEIRMSNLGRNLHNLKKKTQ